MSSNYYKISQVAKILGISTELVRHYERLGILKPKRSQNGYRKYTTRDINILTGSRRYIEMGFSIEATEILINVASLNDAIKSLEDMERRAAKEIRWKQLILNEIQQLKDKYKLIHDYDTNLFKFDIQNSPAVYRINCQKNMTIPLEEALSCDVKKWIEKLPVVRISPEFTIESVYNMTDDYCFGYVVDESLAEELDLINTPGIKYYSSCLCLRTIIKSEGDAVEKAVVQANGDVAKLKEKLTSNVSHDKVEKTFDVIVVGGGGAGISAVSAAAQSGSSVVIVEKTAFLGGNTIVSGFAWNAVNPETQSTIETKPGQIDMLKEFLEYDEKDFGEFADTLKTLKTQINTYLAGDTSKMFDSVEFHMIQTYLGGKRQDKDGNWIEGNYDLLSTLVDKSLETNKWVRSLGGKYSEDLTSPVGSMWLRGHNPEDKKQIFDALSDFVLKQNDKNEIMLETRAEELVVEDGRVVGIKATKVDGTEVVLHANKGVILATGGYGANAKLAAEYNNYWPSVPEDMKTTNVATATGDGIIMGNAAGANLIGMEFIQLMPTSNEKTGALTDGLLVAPQNYIFVNKEGKRFINEYAERDTLAFAALEQPGEMFYTIADQDMAMTSQNRPTQEMIDNMVENGIIYRDDTLEGLAEIIGCDAQTFVDEINKYNSYVDNGKDPDFGKPVFEMKVLNGPFYACPAKPAIHHTMGGLQINTNAQVLNTEGNVIPGLYAAGEVTGGIHAGNRLGGNAIADIFVFGRIAGENAGK